MDDFLTTLTKRTLNLLPVVQPAIASMFAPAAAITADLFYSMPAFERHEVRDNLEERADALTQPIGPSFSLSHPVQMKSVLPANAPIAPDHLSFQSSALTFDLELQIYAKIRESVTQNIPKKANSGEELGVSSPVGNRIPFEAIASIQPSKESAVSPKTISVNALEPQNNLSQSKKKEEETGESLVVRPSPEAVQVAATDSHHPIVSGAIPPLGNAVRRTREGDIAETQAPLDLKSAIDALPTVINSSFPGIREMEKLPTATSNLALEHFEAMDVSSSIQPSVESTLNPQKTSVNAVENQQNLPEIDIKEKQTNTGESMPIASSSPSNKIGIIQRQQDIQPGTANSQPVGIYQARDQQENVVRPMLPEKDRFEGQVPLNQKSGIDAPSTVINSSFQEIREPEKLPATTSNLALGHFEAIEAIASIQPSEKSELTHEKPLFKAGEQPQNIPDPHKKQKGRKAEKLISTGSDFHSPKIGTLQKQQDIQAETSNSQQSPIYEASYPQENAARPMRSLAGRDENQALSHRMQAIDALVTMTGLSSQGVSKSEKNSGFTPNLLVGNLEAIPSGFHLSGSSQIAAIALGVGVKLEPQHGNSEKLELELKRPGNATNSISSSGPSLDTLTERSHGSMERKSSAIEVRNSQETEGTVLLPQTLKAQMVSYFKLEENIKKPHIKPPTEEKRELARLSIAKVENVNSTNHSLPLSDRHLLNETGEPLVWETPVEINALVHRVDPDKRALVRPMFDSGMGVSVDTYSKLLRAAEQNFLSKQPSRFTQRRSTDSRRWEPKNEREIATQASSSTTTIQVTIGRIEVCASKSPELTRTTRTVRTRPALSLDEYLKQRNGREK